MVLGVKKEASKTFIETKMDMVDIDGQLITRMTVALDAPLKEKDHWSCRYHIKASGVDLSKQVNGQDSWQAFELALEMLRVNLRALRNKRNGRLEMHGTEAEEWPCSMLKL